MMLAFANIFVLRYHFEGGNAFAFRFKPIKKELLKLEWTLGNKVSPPHVSFYLWDLRLYTCSFFYQSESMLLFFQRIHRKFGFIPVGFLGLDSTLSLFECLTSNVVKVADYFLAAGVLWGWLSAITGLFSLYAIRGKKRAFYYATAHGYINGMALLVLTILWANETTSHKAGPAVKTAVVALKFGMLAVLFYGISFSIKRVRKEN